MIKNKLSELHTWLGEHEKFVLILLFSFTFLYGITFDEIPKIVLLILIIPLTALEVIRVGKIYVDYREPLVFLGLSTFYIFWGVIVIQGQGFALLCLMLYILSKYIVLSHCKNDTKTILYYIIFFSLMIFILGVLDYIPVFNGSYAVEAQRWPSFWKKELWVRDQLDCYFVMISGLPVYAIYLLIKKKKEGFLLLLFSVAGVLITIYGQGRGITVIFAVSSIITLVFIVFRNWKNKRVRLIVEIIAGVGIVCLIIAYVMYSNNILGLADIYKKSFWSAQGGIFKNIRFKLKREQLKLLFDYPFGRCDVELYVGETELLRHVHDTWLDIARRGGLIPFTLVCIYSFVSTADLIKIWSIDEADDGLKICLTGLFYAVNLICWVEPMIVMRKSFWGITYMLAGLFRGLLLTYRKDDKSEGIAYDLLQRKYSN